MKSASRTWTRLLPLLASVILCPISAADLSAQDLIIFDETSGNGSPRGFYSVDPDDGSISLLTTVGSASGDRLTGFSYCPEDGMVYAGSNAGRIWKISPVTGETSLVGDTGLNWIRGLTFSPVDGKLYGLGLGPKLYEVNPDTADLLELGTVPDLDAGLAASANGMLYGQKDSPKVILAINIVTLVATTIHVSPEPLPMSNFTFASGGRLFGVNWGNGGVYEFDLQTHTTLEVGRYSEHIQGTIGVFAIPEPVTLPVLIDVKPGSWPNPLNPKSRGVLPTAVLGSETFDVTTIDPATIVLGMEGDEDTVSPLRWNIEDVGTPFEGDPGDGHDLGADGFDDLTLKFKMQDIVTAFDLWDLTGETVALTISGELADGTAFEGTDWLGVLTTGSAKEDLLADLQDFGIALESFGQQAASPSAIPEPATAVLVALGALAMIRRRTRR